MCLNLEIKPLGKRRIRQSQLIESQFLKFETAISWPMRLRRLPKS